MVVGVEQIVAAMSEKKGKGKKGGKRERPGRGTIYEFRRTVAPRTGQGCGRRFCCTRPSGERIAQKSRERERDEIQSRIWIVNF